MDVSSDVGGGVFLVSPESMGGNHGADPDMGFQTERGCSELGFGSSTGRLPNTICQISNTIGFRLTKSPHKAADKVADRHFVAGSEAVISS